jgi:hypothetical protein
MTVVVSALVTLCAVPFAALGAQWPVVTVPTDSMYTRYQTPDACADAAHRLTARYWRDKRADTVRLAPGTDSVPTPVREVVRDCAARFATATVAVDQLIPLGQTRLVLGDDAGAAEAFTRLLASPGARDVKQRSWLLHLITMAYLDAKPTRLALARRYAAQLDSMGTSAAYMRVLSHTHLASYAWTTGDLASAATEAGHAITAFKELPRPEQVNIVDTVESDYFLKVSVDAVTQGGPAALAMLDSTEAALHPLMYADAPWAQLIRGPFERGMATFRHLYAAIGHPGPAIVGNTWFGGVEGDTIFPKAGRVTLVVLVNQYTPFPVFSTIRRLHALYAARGLDIVCVSRTEAYFRSSLMPKTLEEMVALKSWYNDFLHIPATFAIEVGWLERLSDGRERGLPSVNQHHYEYGTSGVVVGKTGTMDAVLNVFPADEAVLTNVIATALAK